MTGAELDTALHGVAIYNPDLLSRDELKRYFVGRLPLLERILAELKRERPEAIPQHRLILGQRGMGKTSLLRRLAVAVEEDPRLAEIWLPLTFPEEQYNVADLADLWLNCLDALGDALEQAGDTDRAEALDILIESLADADAETVLRALLDQARGLDRRLLLLLDNADLILQRLRNEHWALRETLQSEPRILVFAASAGAIEASYKYDAAFYDFFRIDELKGLTEDELRATLIRLAELGNTPAVTGLVHQDPARIRTLHLLTGGNPRTTVLLYGVLAQGPSGDVRSDLESLLDRVTPLYKARFEELPEQAQRLVDALALHWDPATARTLADRLGWEINLVSAQLKRLQDQGVVEKTAPYRDKRTLFQLAERFFNIWYLMRASRRVRRRLTWLVRFLRMFYNADELRERARGQLASRRTGVDPRQAEYSLALAQCVDHAPLRSALEHQGLKGLMDNGETRRRLGELLDLRGEDACLATRAERLQALTKCRERIGGALKKTQDVKDRDQLLFRLLGSPSLTLEEKRGFAKNAPNLEPDRWVELDQIHAYESADLVRFFGTDPSPLYRAIGEGDMVTADDIEGAKAAAERLAEPDLFAMAWLSIGFVEKDRAEEALDTVAASQLESTFSWAFRGNLLQVHLARYDEAERAFRRAIEIDPTYARPWNGLGNLLQVHLARYDEAEQAYRRAIEIDPKWDVAYNNLAWLMFEQGRDLSEARRFAETALELSPTDLQTIHTLATVRTRLDDWPAAAPLIRRLVDAGDDAFHDLAWNGTLTLFREAVRTGRAADARDLLDAGEAGERWRPLREALAAAAEGSEDYLRQVSPEVGVPAKAIFRRLTQDAGGNN